MADIEVNSVQELASANLQNIPDRYIRPEINHEEVSEDDFSSQIPVIDMAKLASHHLGYHLEMAKLHQACLPGMGLFSADEAIEKMKVVLQDFFKLPLEQKMAYARLPNKMEGYGQALVGSDNQKLDWGDRLFLIPLPAANRNLRFWPNIPPSFRSTFDECSMELHKVSFNLIKSMAANLGVDEEKLGSMFQDGQQAIRMNYYPPCVEADKVYGLAPHSDATGLTLLVEVNEVEGLQIRKNSKWLTIKPVPGAVTVNIGDVLEIMSNGKYTSVEHRAVVNYQKERISMAAFHSPNMRTKIGPLQDLAKENGAKYNTFEPEDFARLAIISSIHHDGKSLLDQMRINQ